MTEKWISRSEWEALLEQARFLMNAADRQRSLGKDTKALWTRITPLNRQIRSPLLKVRGIDDQGRA
jgi:hypothetical protein